MLKKNGIRTLAENRSPVQQGDDDNDGLSA